MDRQALNKTYNIYDEEIILTEPEKLNENRQQEKFTDLVLVTSDGTKHHVHKIIIYLRCPYFEGLFNSNLKESEQTEIQLGHDISAKYFEAILIYIYTGRIEFTTENAFIINENACYLGLKKLKEESEKALIECMNMHNVLTLWRWAEKLSNNKLTEMCIEFILKRSREFFEQYILNLEYNEILNLSSSFDFDQDELYTNLIKWIKVDFENREKYIVDLLQNIDFAALSDDLKINQIKTDTLLLSNPNFNKVMFDIAINKRTRRDNKHKMGNAIIKNDLIATYYNDIIFAISSLSISVIKFYKPHPRLVPLAEFELNKTFQPIYNTSANIFFCGLEEGKSCKNFSYRTNTFNDLSPMLESREMFGITKLGDKIFVCGGESNKGSVEIYDINTDKWIYGASMSKQQLYGFKLVNYNQSIYSFGGLYKYGALNKDGKIYNETPSSCIIQRYDPRENVWETVSTEAIDMAHLIEVFAIKDNTVRCFYKNYYVCACEYDVRNNSMRNLPIKLAKFSQCNLYKSKNDIYVLGENMENSRFNHTTTKKFGRFDSISDSITFTVLQGLDLNSYHGNLIKLINVGPDVDYIDNYLNPMLS